MYDVAELRIHHGGSFKNNPELSYVNGDVGIVKMDPDLISFPHLVKFITEESYKKVESLSFKLPEENFNKLRPLWDDASTLELIQVAMNLGTVDIFVQHGIDEPDIISLLPPDSIEAVQRNVQVQGEETAELQWQYEELEREITQSPRAARSESQCETDIMETEMQGMMNTNMFAIQTECEDEENCSDYYDSDEDPPTPFLVSEEEDNVSEVHPIEKKTLKPPSYNPKSNSKQLDVEMLFDNGRQFKSALINYAIDNKRDIRWIKNEPLRVQAGCAANCPFKCTGSWSSQYKCFQLKTWVDIHKCNNKFKLKVVSQTWLEEKYEDKIRENPCIGKVELQKHIRSDLNIHVNISKVKRAIVNVLKKVNASFGEQFRRLRDYAQECLRSNPGSTAIVKTNRVTEDGPEVFQRIYVCFGALKRGFLSGCRKVIGLDGSFLKGLLKGELLSAVGRDGNNEMYPIAWAVVEIENTDSWRWFLDLLKHDLEISNTYHWTFMSDQQKGLMNAIKDLFPNSEQRNCCRHIHANWSKRHRGHVMKKHFWACARSTTEAQFQEQVSALAKINSQAKADLEVYDTHQWCKAFFRTDVKCDILDNNLSEAFNNTIVKARSKPIIPMLEAIRIATMKRIAKKIAFGRKWVGNHGPRIMKKLNSNTTLSMGWKVVFNGDDGYEVKRGRHQYKVRLEGRTCSCRAWELSGIPCPHAICAIFDRGGDPQEFIHECYSKAVYQTVYSHHLEPMNGELLWENTQMNDIAPPIPKKMSGRPKKKRTREATEVPAALKCRTTISRKGRVMTCSNCKMGGHNKAKCPTKPTDTQHTSSKRKTMKQRVVRNARSGKKKKQAGECIDHVLQSGSVQAVECTEEVLPTTGGVQDGGCTL